MEIARAIAVSVAIRTLLKPPSSGSNVRYLGEGPVFWKGLIKVASAVISLQ
jgi:hypothetical protein